MNVAIIGASGAIGSAFINILLQAYDIKNLYAFSRSGKTFADDRIISKTLDLEDEDSIAHAANFIGKGELDLIIVATGMLYVDDIMPEKSLKELSAEKFQKIFAINTIGPALIAKHFIAKLSKDRKSTLVFLSARVGSISDNYLGGWYSYRASKAALNMIIKNLSIETNRQNKHAIIIGMHPGTVDSRLSKPFQSQVKEGKLFTAKYSAEQMLKVVEKLNLENSGNIFSYDGQKIEY